MARPVDLAPLLRPDRPALRDVAPGIVSALPADERGAPYDRHARVYDRLVGSRRYNQLIWAAEVDAYAAFAAEAAEAADGPMLDAGCGTCVFTAAVYRRVDRPLVLADRSVGMLAKAGERLGGEPTLLQADLFDLPTRPGSFASVGCFAMLHVLDEPWLALDALAQQLVPGAPLYASMLVTDHGRLATPYLRLLRRAGEMGPLRSSSELEAAARNVLDDVQVERRGAMAYLRARRSAT